MNLSEVSDRMFQDSIEPLMIAIQHDAQVVFGKMYSNEELFQRAVSLHLYALSKGKTVRVDAETKNVIVE